MSLATLTHNPKSHITDSSPPRALPLKPRKRQPRGFTNVRMDSQGGITAPMVFCERCGAQVKDVHMAGVFWRLSREGEAASITILCKPQCTMALEFRDWPWDELSAYLFHLLWNMGIQSRSEWIKLFERPRCS